MRALVVLALCATCLAATWVVRLSPRAERDPEAALAPIADQLAYVKRVGALERYHALAETAPDTATEAQLAARLRALGPAVEWFARQEPRRRDRRQAAAATAAPNASSSSVTGPFADPLAAQQWQLFATEQYGVGVTSLWASEALYGSGVRVCVIDDGVDVTHPDVAPSFDMAASYNVYADTASPMPSKGNTHGTACTGVATARNNTSCGVGSAFGARSSHVLLLGSSGVTDLQEAEALHYASSAAQANAISGDASMINHIFSCSWGPIDDGERFEQPGPLALEAIAYGIKHGRNGLGSLYFWAAGNGGLDADNCNYDGYANLPATIAIGAIDSDGFATDFSEPCAALFAVAPGLRLPTIVPTRYAPNAPDLGPLYPNHQVSSECTLSFSGTSASAPLAAGVGALVLEANPLLTWRDVQHIFALSSKVIHPEDSGWTVNAAGYWHHHRYGFGLLDAPAAVSLARTWTSVGASAGSIRSATFMVDAPIPELEDVSDDELQTDDGTPFTNSTILDAASLAVHWHCHTNATLEHVQLTFTTSHKFSGDLRLELESPSGTRSVLTELHASTRLLGLSVSPAPANLTDASFLVVEPALYGPPLSTLRKPLRIVVASPAEACTALTNAAASLAGAVVFVQRGTCSFINKTIIAQRAGAAAIIVVNSKGASSFWMSASEEEASAATIPSALMQFSVAQPLLAAVQSGEVATSTATVATSSSKKAISISSWELMSVRLWGERALGRWTLRILDMDAFGASKGRLTSWSMLLHTVEPHIHVAPVAAMRSGVFYTLVALALVAACCCLPLAVYASRRSLPGWQDAEPASAPLMASDGVDDE